MSPGNPTMIADIASGQGSVARATPPRLLVVDHHEESRVRVAEYFRARGYDVIVARDGVEAIACAVTHDVDAVVMNATLPGLEGYEAAAIVRRLRPEARIVLTTEGELDSRPRESERREVFRCFPAPLDLESMARVIGHQRSGPDPVTGTTQEGAR
jgi:CheY-like chemotaxis protein